MHPTTSLLPLLLCGLALFASAAENHAPLQGLHRVVFLGDSITQDGNYVTDVACWLEQQKIQVEVLNLGLSSETATDLTPAEFAGHLKTYGFGRPCISERLGRVLAATYPDVLVACYGMNDGSELPTDDSGTKRFAAAITRLRDTALKSGVKNVVFCTPPVRDSAEDQNLTRYSEWLLSQKSTGWTVVDIHGPMRAALDKHRKKDSAFTFANDGVHPNREGHWLMANCILTQWLGANLHGVASAEVLLGTNGTEERNHIQQQLGKKFNEWMTKIGHKRPGVAGGPEMPKPAK